MVYHVIGLMSGSSLDGLDIAYVQLEEIGGQWSHQILQAETMPYTTEWYNKLLSAKDNTAKDLMLLHTAYGRLLGTMVSQFIATHQLEHKVHFIASHGHTLWHEPQQYTTVQIGDGASIAALTGLPVISDLRAMDVALGGQGAPIVPIGDSLLFGKYDYLLNIGGIANITIQHKMLAFDVCVANQALNFLAQQEGQSYDDDGKIAASGKVINELLALLNQQPYYAATGCKSLSNTDAMALATPVLQSSYSAADKMATLVAMIAQQVRSAIINHRSDKENTTLLITGGGAFNSHLVRQISEAVKDLNVTVVLPDAATIQFKEALIMALIGTLRWREENNVLSSVTGARRDSIGGALWIGTA